MGRDTPFAPPQQGTNHANGEASPKAWEASPKAWEGRAITDTWIHKPLSVAALPGLLLALAAGLRTFVCGPGCGNPLHDVLHDGLDH